MRALVTATILMATTAGCVAPPPDAGIDAPTAQALAQGYDASGCDELGIFLSRPFEQARRWLPEGFEPADGQAVLGTPQPTGQALLLVYTATCAEGELTNGTLGEGGVTIALEPPTFDAAEPFEGAIHLYDVVRFAPPGTEAEFFASLGWSVLEVAARASVEALPTGSTRGEGSASGPDGFDAAVAAPVPSRIEPGARFWHVTAEGVVAFVDYRARAEVGVGSATCELRGRVAEIVGASSCAPGPVAAFAGSDFAWKGVVRTFPGATLGATAD